MSSWFAVAATVAAGAIAVFLIYRAQTRVRSFNRLPRRPSDAASPDVPPSPAPTRRFPRRYRAIPWVIAIVALVVMLFFRLHYVYAVAIAAMIGLLVGQAESSNAERRLALMESQLADAIDLMVSTLHAGGTVIIAIENASREIHDPLRRYLVETLSRIRYGEDPKEVVRRLPAQIPMESFRLFSAALGIHWEVGGSLAPILATVGRTVRDRIDVSRRTHSLTAQARVSTIALLAATYFLALLMWRNAPAEMSAFLTSSLGRTLVAGSLVLQAVGIVWQSAISKPQF